MPEIQRVLPKYLQIAEHIRDRIVCGDLRPGDDVSSERELAAAWSVARPTAAKALESLRVQGLVESRQGSGTYVRGQVGVPRARERYERARELGTMYGAAESVDFLEVGLVEGPAHVIAALAVPEGSTVGRRTRLLRGEEGLPIELSTSWFAGALVEHAPRLLIAERLLGGTGRYIAEMTGRESVYARDQVAARIATDTEQRLLQAPTPAAVLIYRLTVYDQSDQPVQFDDAVYPSDRWAFRQEYPLAR
ncbi:MAG: GntR family transcriptional regulator [Pseudonocardia sp.]